MHDHRPFSWLKAFAHSIAIAALFLLPALAFSIAGVVNAKKAGEFSGGFMMAGLVLGWVWSYARQQGHATTKHVVVFILVAMSAYQVFVLTAAAVTRNEIPAVAEIEKHPPSVHRAADGLVLCQQDVGLRIPVGDLSLSPAPDLAAVLAQKDPTDAVARWAYREASGDILVLMAAKGFDSEESLHNFAKGASGAAEGRMEKVRESVQWNTDHGTIVLAFRDGDAARFDVRCVSAPNGDLACAQTIGAGPDRLAGLRDQLSFGTCP